MPSAARKPLLPHISPAKAAAALVLALGGGAEAACAQGAAKTGEGFELSGTNRTRLETIAGQARAGFNSRDELLNLRTTVLAEYTSGPVRLAAELWDSRVYGGNRGSPVTPNEVNTFELVQAFVEFKAHEPVDDGSAAAVQAGRFMLNLGSRRLVAADDYRNTTNGYTGLHGVISGTGGWMATLIYTLPQLRRPEALDDLLDNDVKVDRESFGLVLWGGMFSKARALGPVTAETSFFHLGERDSGTRRTRDRSLNTAAVRLFREPKAGGWDVEIEGIAQRGHVSASLADTAPRQPVRAWFLHADVGYTFAGRWQPRVSIDYDHASGDGRGTRFGRFDTLFGMRRADLAPAGLYNAIARTNLITPGVRVQAVPDKRTDWFVSYRPMWLASRFDSFSSTGVRDPFGRSGRFAGHQIDARIRYRLSSAVRLEADAVVLAKGRFLRDAPNAPPRDWTRYVSLNVMTSF